MSAVFALSVLGLVVLSMGFSAHCMVPGFFFGVTDTGCGASVTVPS